MPRPRKSGARTKAGHRSRAYKGPARDAGTQETQFRRLAMVGPDADPVLASSALGCLFARKYIDRDRYDAGLDFGRARCALFGPPWPGNTFGLEASDERLEDMKKRFARMIDLLSVEQERVVANVAAFNFWPNWFFLDVARLKWLPEDKREHELLMSGLGSLANGQRSNRRRRPINDRVAL